MDKTRHVRGFRPEYPRPQFVRESFVSLDGTWLFLFDDEDVGEKKGFYKKVPEGVIEKTDPFVFEFEGNKAIEKKEPYKKLTKGLMEIKVPFAYQTEASGINEQKHHPILWYFKKIELKKPKHLHDLILNFMAVDYLAKVYVNGQLVGVHEGGYDAFQVDITNAVKTGENLIVVRVEDGLETDKPRGKQSWREEPWGCWYTPYSGIYKSVFLEEVPHTRIESIRFKNMEDQGGVLMEISIVNPSPNVMTVHYDVEFKGERVHGAAADLCGTKAQIFVPIETQKGHGFAKGTWAPDHPDLYEVDIRFDERRTTDRVKTYFGLSTFRAENGAFVHNHVPTYLKMVMDQGFLPRSGPTFENWEQIYEEVSLIKKLGFNGVRVHQKIEDDRFYYACDILGLFCTLEMPSPYTFTEKTIERLTREWTAALKSHLNYPSIVMQMPLNESWGVPDIYESKTQQALSLALYDLSKAIDGSRLVISNDGWEHTLSDAVTIHDYEQDPDQLFDTYSDPEAYFDYQIQNGKCETRIAFCKGYRYNGEPIFLDEIGGVGYCVKKGAWGYGVEDKEEDYIERLRGILEAVTENRYVAGYCLTQLCDTYGEQNGILDENRKPKIDIEKLIRIIAGEDI